MRAMRRVVHVHIGAPKTGTTYVQDRLALNVAELGRNGVLYPGQVGRDPSSFHFRAALDLLGQDWGGEPGHAAGAWDAMVRKARRHPGKVLISHEILAPAGREHVERLTHDLRNAEVHVVYSVRDLGRQLPAAWQESIKQGRRWTFRRFLDKVEQGEAWFGKAFDLPRVLNTWGANLPPERVHVVTFPRSRKDPTLLWRRFCTAFDIDPAWAPQNSERANRSLGAAETQLIRQLNQRMGRSPGSDRRYDVLIKEMLAQGELAQRRSRKVTLPPERYEWAEHQAELWIDWIRGSGIDLIGELDDLRPQRPAEDAPWLNPDRVQARPMLDAALDALEAMTREAANRQDPYRQLSNRVLRKLGMEGE